MNINNLSLKFGLQVIFDDITVKIKNDSKVGLVGVNGAGKSTFFNVILGNLEPDSGSITFSKKLNVGYLPQVITDDVTSSDITVFDYLLLGRPIKKLEQDLVELYNKVAIEQDDRKVKILLNDISKVQAKLDYYDQYTCESVLLKLIAGMNITDDLLDMKLCNLSGGQKSKVAFARLLYSKPDIMLLDEPTNHLDASTKDYVINYLKNYSGMIIVISHDVEFLDLVTTETLYLDKLTHKMEIFKGSYNQFKKILEERKIAKERLYERQQVEEEKLKRIIAKYIRGNEKKANIAKDRIKKLERLEKNKVELDETQKYSRFKLTIDRESGTTPIRVERLKFGYDEKNILFSNLRFNLSRGEKFLIVGENGVGKSTLLKLLIGLYEPLEGIVELDSKTTIGYYAQEHELLDLDSNIIDNFKDFDLDINELRSFLGSFLFFGDDVFKNVGILSPGERSRVALAKIALSGNNLLLLDEPTNHLDPETQKIIADTFSTYEGTMLVVSHNIEFVNNLGIERMLLLPSGEIKYYDEKVVRYYQELNNKDSK